MPAASASVRLLQPSLKAQSCLPQPVSSSPQQSSRAQARLRVCRPPGRSPASRMRPCLIWMLQMWARPVQVGTPRTLQPPRTAHRVCSTSALTASSQTTARCHTSRQTGPASQIQVVQAQKPVQLPCHSCLRPPFNTPLQKGAFQDQMSLQVGRAAAQGSRCLQALQHSLRQAASTRPALPATRQPASQRRGLKKPPLDCLALLRLLPAMVRKLTELLRKLKKLLRKLQDLPGPAARRRPAPSASTPSPASSGCVHGAPLFRPV